MQKSKPNISLTGQANSSEKSGDFSLLAITGLLLAFGLVVLFSASSAAAYVKFGDSYYIIRHQIYGLAVGMLLFYFFSKINYHIWKKNAALLLVFSIGLLTLVFIPGIRGEWGSARSWIEVFGLSLQPSEFVKLFFLMYLAAWLEKRKSQLGDPSAGLRPFLFVLGIIIVLMLLQPDIGTLAIITATSLLVYYIAGGKLTHIIMIVLIGMMGLGLMVQVKSYQKDRFRCLIDPGFDTQKTCYQVNQALIAVGSGGLWGRGLGASRQKFMYLPEVWGDSIFAVIAEELGFFSCIFIVILYIALFLRGFAIARNSQDDFGKILSIGIVSWITFQSFINIGGIINLIPMTGVPLPLISYGGSSVMASMAAIGVLFNISKYQKNAGK